MRFVGLVPPLAATLLLAGCYNPSIQDGGLHCSPNFECPSGFKCNQSNGLCYKSGAIPPISEGGVSDDGGMCTMQVGKYGPIPGCTPPSMALSGCDPVCQTGCACTERCKLENGNPVCRVEGPDFKSEYQDCDPKADLCRPGAICLQESDLHPACGAHCYRLCRTDTECPGAKCSVDVQFGTSTTTYKACSPPVDTCQPWGAARCTNQAARPATTFGCYIMSGAYPDLAICDCAGTTLTGQPCMFEHECEPGSECVAVDKVRLCRRVCKLGAGPLATPMTGGCPATLTCTMFPGSSVYGYCK